MLLPDSFDLPSSRIRLLLLFLGVFTKLWKATFGCLPFHPSIHPFIHLSSSWNTWAPFWMVSHEIWYLSIFQKSVKKIQVSLKADKYNWYFIPEYQYTFCVISHSVLLRMRNVSDTNYRENHNTHFMFNNFFPKSHALYEIMW